MSVLFLYQLKSRGIFDRYKDRFVPSPCRSALVKLDRRLPNKEWNTKCELNNMHVTINSAATNTPKNIEHYKTYLYRELANHLNHVAQNSPDDNLEKIDWVKLTLKHNGNSIEAVTAGKHLVKLQTLKNAGLIAEHLKNTVRVKESIKVP